MYDRGLIFRMTFGRRRYAGSHLKGLEPRPQDCAIIPTYQKSPIEECSDLYLLQLIFGISSHASHGNQKEQTLVSDQNPK